LQFPSSTSQPPPSVSTSNLQLQPILSNAEPQPPSPLLTFTSPISNFRVSNLRFAMSNYNPRLHFQLSHFQCNVQLTTSSCTSNFHLSNFQLPHHDPQSSIPSLSLRNFQLIQLLNLQLLQLPTYQFPSL
jgi:hypothetical protein